MTEASRLAAALFMAVLALVLSVMVQAILPSGSNFLYFNAFNAFLGLCVGWRVLGPRAGYGTTPAINNGITAVLVFIFLGLFIHSVNRMLNLALSKRYDETFEALLAAVQIGIDNFMRISSVTFWITAIVGGIVAGLLTEFIKRRTH